MVDTVKGKMPKEHSEHEVGSLGKCSSLKYSGNNVEEMDKRSKSLADYVKSNEMKHS